MRRLFLIAALAAAGLPASADAVLQKARTPATNGPVYAFDLDYSDGTDQFRMSVDPTQPEGKRVVRISPDPKTLKGDSAKTAERLMTRTEGKIMCSEFAANIPANAKRASETDTAITYTFTPTPGPDDGDIAKAYKFLNGKAVIEKDTGNILSFEMIAPKAFKPMTVAKVDKMTFKVACKAAPDGRTHIDTFSFNMAGSAMMQAFSQNETRKVSNLKQVAASGYGAP
ncbi:hypothetical protein [Hyphomonas sp.]|uniref:hypothetical protein n=1 Tax=Hyphomonas sp. TaxID=87 RepID=UPI00391C4598